MSAKVGRPLARFVLAASLGLAVGACRQDMFNQPKVRPLQSSTFFADGRASRPLPEDTVARGDLRADELLYTGRIGGTEADTFPFPVTKAVLDRGQERFEIYCSPCHGRAGYGDGMIVQRGFKAPPSFHADRLRQAPVGHFVDVMANGFGVMYDYRGRVSPEDRWAIAAYIRALQLSQNATAGDLDAVKASENAVKAAHPSGGAKP
ncbi:MAG TPA: cytochrome c [Thermoanaerobaculia bacterium]|nr:cytochrome c [Thermoanaerobaculia bacterium]